LFEQLGLLSDALLTSPADGMGSQSCEPSQCIAPDDGDVLEMEFSEKTTTVWYKGVVSKVDTVGRTFRMSFPDKTVQDEVSFDDPEVRWPTVAATTMEQAIGVRLEDVHDVVPGDDRVHSTLHLMEYLKLEAIRLESEELWTIVDDMAELQLKRPWYSRHLNTYVNYARGYHIYTVLHAPTLRV